MRPLLLRRPFTACSECRATSHSAATARRRRRAPVLVHAVAVRPRCRRRALLPRVKSTAPRRHPRECCARSCVGRATPRGSTPRAGSARWGLETRCLRARPPPAADGFCRPAATPRPPPSTPRSHGGGGGEEWAVYAPLCPGTKENYWAFSLVRCRSTRHEGRRRAAGGLCGRGGARISGHAA